MMTIVYWSDAYGLCQEIINWPGSPESAIAHLESLGIKSKHGEYMVWIGNKPCDRRFEGQEPEQ